MTPSDTIETIQRTDDVLALEFTEETVDVTGNVTSCLPLDITGFTVRLIVKQKLSDPDDKAVIDIVQTAHTDPVNGKTTISLTPADLARHGEFKYEYRLITPANTITKSAAGKFIIEEDV